MPSLLECAINSPPPLVAFAPIQKFQQEVDLSASLDPRLLQEHAQGEVWKIYHHSMALGYALNEGSPCGLELHSVLYNAAWGSPFACALCDAAGWAFRLGSDYFPAFVVSTHLPGFLNALEVWTKRFEYNILFNGPEKLPFIHREIIRKDVPGADYWMKACQDGFATTREFFEAIPIEHRRAVDAERKKTGTDAPARFLDRIEWGWLPMSFWARPTKSIAYLLEPTLKDTENATARVGGDISTFHKKVKMLSSHKGRNYGGIIERAERAVENSFPTV